MEMVVNPPVSGGYYEKAKKMVEDTRKECAIIDRETRAKRGLRRRVGRRRAR